MANSPGARIAGELRQASRVRLAVAYGLMLAVCVLVFLLVRVYGEKLPSQLPAAPGSLSAASGGDSQHSSLLSLTC